MMTSCVQVANFPAFVLSLQSLGQGAENPIMSRWIVQMVEEGRNLFGVNTKIREVVV